MSEPRVVKICRNCKSENIRKDADAVWNPDTQEWELNAVYDRVTCEDCSDQSNWPDEKPYEDDRFPMEEWQREAGGGDTVLGYLDWRAHKIESES